MNVGWIFYTDAGKEFLGNILISENAEIYENKTVKYIIHCLYREYKTAIARTLLSLYKYQVVILVG